MKIRTTIIAVLTSSFALCDAPEHYLDWVSALPLQAAVCDVIGIGALESQTSTSALINVSQFWLGNPQTNIIDVSVSQSGVVLPSEGTNFLFFISTHSKIGRAEPLEMRFTCMFRMDAFRSKFPADSMYLLSGNRSWILATDDNAGLINWCSNLVQTSQINPDMYAFYELIRDGHRLHPPSSRIHRDSIYAFRKSHHYMPTNFMQQVWSDTNLTGWARAWINNTYRFETGSFLPESEWYNK